MPVFLCLAYFCFAEASSFAEASADKTADESGHQGNNRTAGDGDPGGLPARGDAGAPNGTPLFLDCVFVSDTCSRSLLATETVNAWVTDPPDPKPELVLSWPDPVSISRVILEFDPDWDHRSSRFDHSFPKALTIKSLTLRVHASNGSPTAVFRIRVLP